MLERIFTFCRPDFRDGYDVQFAVMAAERSVEPTRRRFGGNFLCDDLFRDTIAAMNQRWPVLIAELRAGLVFGRHGSSRRFGPDVRYYLWDDEANEVDREGWLSSAASAIEVQHDRARLSAYRNIGKDFSYAAFQSSLRPDELASSLSAALTRSLCLAEDGSTAHRRLLDDLSAIGHPFNLWDDGDGKNGWGGFYSYVPQTPGDPPRAVTLAMEIEYVGEASPPRHAEVRVYVTGASDGAPGFPG